MAVQLQGSAGQVFGPSGANHSQGLVPDPGTVTGTTRLLAENATWFNPASITQVATPTNANAAAAGVPVGGFYTGTVNPFTVYVRTA